MNTKVYQYKFLMYTSIGMKKMHISKFRVVLAVIILSIILGTSLVMALVEVYYTIPSSGSIGTSNPIISGYEVADKSEIRAMFIHFTSLSATMDWNLIAQTLNNYGIQTVVIEVVMPKYVAYPSSVVAGSAGLSVITDALNAFHPLGIDVYAAMDVLYTVANPEHAVVNHLGSTMDWTSPIKQSSRNYIKAIVEELVTNYPDIDGFMFDYIRWEWEGVTPTMDYSPEAKPLLESYLNETIISFPGEFAPGGSRYDDFLEWRKEPITNLLKDMIDWMKAIKPDLKISAAPWSIYTPSGPAERFKLIGQDWVDWVMKGYLDWVAPMLYLYPNQMSEFRESVRGNVEIGVGGPEGKIPMIMFVANQYPVIKTTQEFKTEIDILRDEGADGWIIWKYGGPGLTIGVGEDIRPYLDALDLFDVFSISDVSVYPQETNGTATITWVTTQPATSKVEYSTSPLFIVITRYDSNWDFDYLDIDQSQGTIAEDLENVTQHALTLANLDPNATYYFRVQSQGLGIVTSKVFEFSISGVNE